MLAKEGRDVFFHTAVLPFSPPFFFSLFFGATITPSLGLLLSLWRLMLKASCGFVSEAH